MLLIEVTVSEGNLEEVWSLICLLKTKNWISQMKFTMNKFESGIQWLYFSC